MVTDKARINSFIYDTFCLLDLGGGGGVDLQFSLLHLFDIVTDEKGSENMRD